MPDLFAQSGSSNGPFISETNLGSGKSKRKFQKSDHRNQNPTKSTHKIGTEEVATKSAEGAEKDLRIGKSRNSRQGLLFI